MKKLLIILISLPLFLVIFGGTCEDEPTEALDSPDTYTLSADINGIDLIIDWDESTSEIEGYYVLFDGTEIYDGVTSQCTHVNPTGLGQYQIVAYNGTEESDPLTFNTSNFVEEVVSEEIWRFDVAGQPSGYGWAMTGGTVSGASYSFAAANQDYVDVYFATYDAIASADAYTGGTDFPNATGIAVPGTDYDVMSEAPSTSAASYENYQDISANQTYALKIYKTNHPNGYYGKMKITAYDDTNHKITFKWMVQGVQNWRILE